MESEIRGEKLEEKKAYGMMRSELEDGIAESRIAWLAKDSSHFSPSSERERTSDDNQRHKIK